MATIHFLNVLEGDCNIIQHDNGNVTVIDVSNAYNHDDSPEEIASKAIKEKEIKTRNFVPGGKVNYKQKENPDNPIEYLNKLKINDPFFVVKTAFFQKGKYGKQLQLFESELKRGEDIFIEFIVVVSNKNILVILK